MAVTAVPAGLAVHKRLFPGSDVSVWDVVHEDSGQRVVVSCRRRTDAVEAAEQLADLADWTVEVVTLRGTEGLSGDVQAIQAAVWSPPAKKRDRAYEEWAAGEAETTKRDALRRMIGERVDG